MGRTKALLPLPGGGCFLTRLASTLSAAGIERIIAVVGYDSAAIRAAVGGDHGGRPGVNVAAAGHSRRAALHLVENPDPTRGQLSSLVAGLDSLEPEPHSAVLVTTVDLPLVVAATVRRVLDAWRASGAAIVRPARAGRHGHPVIFGAALFAELRAADASEGARAVLRAHAGEILDVPVDDPGAFDDIDTPADYERLTGLPFPHL